MGSISKTLGLIIISILLIASIPSVFCEDMIRGKTSVNTSANISADEARLQSILPEFQGYAEKGMKDWQVPGMAVAIVKDDKVVYLHSFGIKTINGTDPVTPDTISQEGAFPRYSDIY